MIFEIFASGLRRQLSCRAPLQHVQGSVFDLSPRENRQIKDVPSTAKDAPSTALLTAQDMYLLRWKPNMTVFKNWMRLCHRTVNSHVNVNWYIYSQSIVFCLMSVSHIWHVLSLDSTSVRPSHFPTVLVKPLMASFLKSLIFSLGRFCCSHQISCRWGEGWHFELKCKVKIKWEVEPITENSDTATVGVLVEAVSHKHFLL